MAHLGACSSRCRHFCQTPSFSPQPIQIHENVSLLSVSRRHSQLRLLPFRGVKIQASLNEEKFTSRPVSADRMATNLNDEAERCVHRICAVVTGANKGIGLETVRQIASRGVKVILTARDVKRGLEATSMLHETGLPNVIFHRLDVLDPSSVESLAKFVDEKFGRLDILVNNAGASGVVVDEEGLRALNIDPAYWLSGEAANLVQSVIKTSYEKAEECIETNYYGVKRVTEALLPLLRNSRVGARIVNASSLRSELKRIPSERIKRELRDVENLTEAKIDEILQKFLHDLRENTLEANGWTTMLPAYSISKATLNAYTRILARKNSNMCINCVHPGFVNTDINWRTGTMSVEEGARGSVMLALLPEGGPSGCYFDQTELAEF